MPSDTPVFVLFVIIVLVTIALAMVAIVTSWKTSGKGPLGPSKGGYRPSQGAEGRPLVINPPKAPEGRGAASS